MKKEISSKFESVDMRLNQLEQNFINNIEQQIYDSSMSVSQDSLQLQVKVEVLEKQLFIKNVILALLISTIQEIITFEFSLYLKL